MLKEYSVKCRKIFKKSVLLYSLCFINVLNCFAQNEISVDDFKFNGPLGSQGAIVEKVKTNHFKVSLGHAPNHPNWCNMLQFQITGHAKGNKLRLDVEFGHPDAQYHFNDYFSSWSYDGINWNPIHWKNYQVSLIRSDVLLFPEFTEDIVYFGHQVPLSYEQLEIFIEQWEKSPYVKIHTLGKSLGSKNIYRLEVGNNLDAANKWSHFFINQHPGEHNSQWRMIGMLEWLLSDSGLECRKNSISHFIFMMSPDAPANGCYRVNAQGVDMNRSYRVQGSDQADQAHEAFICQRDLEDIMDSKNPVTDLWCMHTWQGAVEPLIIPGPEIGNLVGPWTDLKDIIIKNDTALLIEPLKRNKLNRDTLNRWNHGPHAQFGITTVLCEGAGNIYTKEENIKSGEILIKSIAEYYR